MTLKNVYIDVESDPSVLTIRALYPGLDNDWNSLEEVRIGFSKGLRLDQIVLFCSSDFVWQQKESLRMGLEQELSNEQIKIVANNQLSVAQMDQIINGFLHYELTTDKAAHFVEKGFTWQEIERAYLSISKREHALIEPA